nr:zinc finger, CCHC-type [Tanacetum cinerariifolium]GEW95142.1 zinc finger, CCHC-type [Tanacetum cinerariifolium]
MGDANPIRTLRDYSKPSHEGYRNTIELLEENNVVHLRSDTIRLVQNRCSFDGLRSEDPNQHLKDFLKLVDLLDLEGENRERSISIWEDLTTCFLTQFFPPRRTEKLLNDILIQKCSNESNHSQKDQPQPVTEIKTQQPEEPEQTLEDEFKNLHLNLPVLEVLAHAPMYNAILDKYVESLELGKNSPHSSKALYNIIDEVYDGFVPTLVNS